MGLTADNLIIILCIYMVIVGMVLLLVIQWGYALIRGGRGIGGRLRRRHKDDSHSHAVPVKATSTPASPALPAATAPGGHLPPAVKEQLLHESQTKFESALDHTTGQLEHDLQAVADKLTKHLDKLGTTVMNTEMERYSKKLEELRHQADTAIGNAESGINKHQAELEAELKKQQAELEKKMAAAAEVERQKLVQLIDTKLGDAMASFLMETLQHNVDLGAQANYLVAMLDEHKEDFKREVGEGAPAMASSTDGGSHHGKNS